LEKLFKLVIPESSEIILYVYISATEKSYPPCGGFSSTSATRPCMDLSRLVANDNTYCKGKLLDWELKV